MFSSTSLCSLRVFIFLQAFFILFRNLQLERERNLGAFRMLSTFSVCFGWFWNKSLCFDCFNRHFRFVSVCFGLFRLFRYTFSVWCCSLRNKSICFGCFDRHPKHRNKPKQNFQWFRKWTETNAKQILFRLFSVWTENFFYLFRGHPRYNIIIWDTILEYFGILGYNTSHW